MGAGQLLTTQEVADLLRVPISTLYRWRHVGSGPHGFRVGRHTRYRPADVVDWIEHQRLDSKRYELPREKSHARDGSDLDVEWPWTGPRRDATSKGRRRDGRPIA